MSQEVVDASAGANVVFREKGPVELKGVGGVCACTPPPGPAERSGPLADGAGTRGA